MAELKSKDILKAEALIAKNRAAWDAIKQSTRNYEEKYWNDNKDSLQAQGYSYTKNPESLWGGVWTKQVMSQSPTVAQTATGLKNTSYVTTTGGLQMTLQELNTWNQIAREKGFNDVDAVAKWQSEHGLPADGRLEKKSLDKYNSIAQANQQAAITNQQNIQVNPNTNTPKASSRGMTLNVFRNHKNFRDHYGYSPGAEIPIGGKRYPIMVSTGIYNSESKDRFNDHTYALDEETGMVRAVAEDWMGTPLPIWKDGANWIYWDESTEMKKQGGTMNKIKYFQQGGPAPQQDIQQQVIQLVQAALGGDENATQTVNQIMKAAKAGDPKAVQLAQMIQQVAQQMQGQATAAKWGAKLAYIKSIKYAKGGSVCPACQLGGFVKTHPVKNVVKKPTKKVEEKACGGKTKKRYFGGWL